MRESTWGLGVGKIVRSQGLDFNSKDRETRVRCCWGKLGRARQRDQDTLCLMVQSPSA